ncbi:MAG: YoaK family protein [Myxococcota bacterium]
MSIETAQKNVIAGPLPITLLLLTFTTGLVDAVSFLGLGHVFTANMTGNVVFIGFALAGSTDVDAMRSLVAIAAFMVGAGFGGNLAARMKMGFTHRRWLTIAAIFEACLILVAAVSAIGAPLDHEPSTPVLFVVIVTTAMAMGFRNATALRLADPDLKTTVLTLTITGIAADARWAGGQNPRLGRRLASVFALFAGAALGAVLLRSMGIAAALVTMAVVVIGATALYVTHPSALRNA